ncbi:MAG: pro-sigmaK processing inhibitor BofA family protein [Oscillospiraceae bacterium]|jgi:inhibitor of the pro-sigma K processing machinery|nr:pro-sigmaK processing inhibitor BofA family protein [Oscillospiraceae bacterium]
MGLVLFYACLGIAGICVLVSAYRSKRFLLCVFLTALQGIAALFAVNILGSFINIHINVNAFSLTLSGVLGTAGVILMLLFNSFITKT